MAQQQGDNEPTPDAQIAGNGRQVQEADAGAQVEPDQIWKQHRGHRDAGDPETYVLDLGAAEPGRHRVDQQQPEQDQPGVCGEQQQARLQAERDPVDPCSALRSRPVVQQHQRPQRRGEDRGPELRRRHREHRDAGHQHHRHRRVRRADDGAAEREHRPEGDDNANLRQKIDAGHPGQAIRDLREPERERRTEFGAELKFVPDRQHQRKLTGRRGKEQRRHKRPQQRLQHRHRPEQPARPRAQQLDEQGHRMHCVENPRASARTGAAPSAHNTGRSSWKAKPPPRDDYCSGVPSGSAVSVTLSSTTVSP